MGSGVSVPKKHEAPAEEPAVARGLWRGRMDRFKRLDGDGKIIRTMSFVRYIHRYLHRPRMK